MASLAKKATVFPTVLSDMAPSTGVATAAAAGGTNAEPGRAVGAGLPGDGAAAAVAVIPSAGDGTRGLFARFTLLAPLFGFNVLVLGSAAVPTPLASPSVMALMILMCRFVHGRFS